MYDVLDIWMGNPFSTAVVYIQIPRYTIVAVGRWSAYYADDVTVVGVVATTS